MDFRQGCFKNVLSVVKKYYGLKVDLLDVRFVELVRVLLFLCCIFWNYILILQGIFLSQIWKEDGVGREG